AELARFIGACSDNATALSAFRISADDDRLAFVLGMIELLNGRVKRIHVNMEYGAHATLDVIHQLPLARARAADQFLERYVVQDAADGTVDFRPNWLELADILFSAFVGEISGFEAGELDNR